MRLVGVWWWFGYVISSASTSLVLPDIDTYAFCFALQMVGCTLTTCGSAHGPHLIYRVVGALRGGGGG